MPIGFDVWRHPTRTLTRLEVDVLAPTESIILWEVLRGGIFKGHDESPYMFLFPTVYADKAGVVVTADASARTGVRNGVRIQPDGKGYRQYCLWLNFTQDHVLYRDDTRIGYEAVDLPYTVFRVLMLSASGSALKAFRADLTTPRFTVTDTTYVSGRFGFLIDPSDVDNYAQLVLAVIMALSTCHLRAPASPGPRATAVIEVEVDEGGLKLFRDVDEARGIDRASVTVGGFEVKPPTSIVTIFSGNPYTGDRAVEVQKEYARSRGYKVLSPPRDYREAVGQYRMLAKEHRDWLAGKDNYVYQVLGLEEFDLFQNVDFYHGELLEHKTHHQQLKQIPDQEIRVRLEELVDRLSKVTVLTDERDKHIAKARETLRVGW
jgi:hypothetical protein